MEPDQITFAEWYDKLLKQAHKVEARANALADETINDLRRAQTLITSEISRLQAQYLMTSNWNQESYARKYAYLKAQREAIDRLIADVYARHEEKFIDAARDVMTSTTVLLGGGAASVTVDMLQDWVKTQTVDGLLINEWLSKMGKATADRVVAAGRESLILGHGTQQAARHMRKQGIEGSVPGLRALARTFALSASNHASEAGFLRLEGDSGMIEAWEYVATLDGRTCPICGADDARVFPKNGPRPRLPRHINCRCLYVPKIDEKLRKELFSSEVSRPAVKHESRVVHHRDGSTSKKFTVSSVEHTKENYSQWLRRMLREDPAFVRSVLGKTRFELFKAGKISLEKMVVDGRIKRLSEL